MAGDRGRLTIPDLAEALVALAFLGGLAGVFYSGLNSASGYSIFGTGEQYVWQLFMPLAVVVMLAVIYRKATAGGGF